MAIFSSTITIIECGTSNDHGGGTNWRQEAGITNAIYVDVDTTDVNGNPRFSQTPFYFSSLGGDRTHLRTTGATSIYMPTTTGFRVYVRWSDGSRLTPADATSRNWYINWLAGSLALET